MREKDSKVMLIGVKRFVSKQGKEFAILQTTVPFSPNELKGGSFGLRVQEDFVPEPLLSKVDSLEVNKPIIYEYNIVGNRAYISDFNQ